jgi:hypothetical protein
LQVEFRLFPQACGGRSLAGGLTRCHPRGQRRVQSCGLSAGLPAGRRLRTRRRAACRLISEGANPDNRTPGKAAFRKPWNTTPISPARCRPREATHHRASAALPSISMGPAQWLRRGCRDGAAGLPVIDTRGVRWARLRHASRLAGNPCRASRPHFYWCPPPPRPVALRDGRRGLRSQFSFGVVDVRSPRILQSRQTDSSAEVGSVRPSMTSK